MNPFQSTLSVVAGVITLVLFMFSGPVVAEVFHLEDGTMVTGAYVTDIEDGAGVVSRYSSAMT